MANFHKIVADAMRMPVVTADPSGLVNGLFWYNSTSGEVKFRQNDSTIVLGQVSSEFSDAVFRIFDDGDNTKKIAFQAAGISGSTTRTITMPDTDVDLATIAANTAALAGKQDTLSGADAIDVDQGTDTVSLTLSSGTIAIGITSDAGTVGISGSGTTLSIIDDNTTSLVVNPSISPGDSLQISDNGGAVWKFSPFLVSNSGGTLQLGSAASITKDDVSKADFSEFVARTAVADASIGLQNIGGDDSYLDQTSGLKAVVSDSYAAAAAGELMDAADIKAEVDTKADSSDLALYIPLTQKGAASGVVPLNASSKIDSTYLTIEAMEYKGQFNADTGVPNLQNGTGNTGDVYICSVAGTHDFGAGGVAVAQGDWVIYNGATWDINVSSNSVQSVNGQTGVVVLDSDDVAEGSTNLYFTNARVLAAVLTGFSVGADSAIAASDTVLEAFQKAQGQINARISSVSEDTAPALGGNLTLGANQVLHDSDGIQKGQVAGDTYFDDYDHALTLSASTTAVIAGLTVSVLTYGTQKIDYQITSSTGVRMGTLMIAATLLGVSMTDTQVDTADLDISFSAAMNGSNIEISYNNASVNAGTMRAQARRFKA